MKEELGLEEFKDEEFSLNNFETILPDDQLPEIPGEPKIRSSWRRRMANEAGLLDQRPPVERTASQETRLHSPLYLNRTVREFFKTIDEAIVELRLDPIIIGYFEAKRKIAFTGLGTKKDPVAEAALQQRIVQQKQFYADVMPLYVYLRKKGYSWYDLTG